MGFCGTTSGYGVLQGHAAKPAKATKRGLPTLPKQPLIAPTEKNITWALVFMRDTLY